MNNKIIVRFTEEQLMYEEKLNILTGATCKSIFPVSIIHKDKLITGYYCTSGYKRLSACSELTAECILSLMEKIITATEDCCQYLIFPEEYVINTNTTYVDFRYSSIKFTYVPDKDKISFTKKFKLLLKDLREITTDEGRLYLDMFSQLCDVENLSFSKVKLFIYKINQKNSRYHFT